MVVPAQFVMDLRKCHMRLGGNGVCAVTLTFISATGVKNIANQGWNGTYVEENIIRSIFPSVVANKRLEKYENYSHGIILQQLNVCDILIQMQFHLSIWNRTHVCPPIKTSIFAGQCNFL